jgi:phthiocerol/phenolphthiocerol synthesis type-I polyketide synthase E
MKEGNGRHAAAALQDNLEGELAAIWETILGRPAGANSNFFELGGQSIAAVCLLLQIEERFHVSLPPSAIMEAPTPERLAKRLREGARTPSALVAFRPRGERPPLFFVHGADGSVFYYHRLVEHLPPEWPFYGLQATGRLFTGNEELAASYVAEVKAVQPRGPYFLGGYCMGGTVAFEMARQLRSAGGEVGLLAMVDTYDWSRITSGSGLERLASFIQKLDFHRRNFLLLSAREQGLFLRGKSRWAVDWLTKRRERRNARDWGVPDDAFVRLLTEYRPRFYPGDLTHFRSMAAYDRYRGRELSAGAHAAGITVEEIPVYPGGILVEPFVRRLAERLTARIEMSARALRLTTK